MKGWNVSVQPFFKVLLINNNNNRQVLVLVLLVLTDFSKILLFFQEHMMVINASWTIDTVCLHHMDSNKTLTEKAKWNLTRMLHAVLNKYWK